MYRLFDNANKNNQWKESTSSVGVRKLKKDAELAAQPNFDRYGRRLPRTQSRAPAPGEYVSWNSNNKLCLTYEGCESINGIDATATHTFSRNICLSLESYSQFSWYRVFYWNVPPWHYNHVVLDSFNMTFRFENFILDQIYVSKCVRIFIIYPCMSFYAIKDDINIIPRNISMKTL